MGSSHRATGAAIPQPTPVISATELHLPELAIVFAAVTALLAALRIPLTDDAYITLTHARTLATSGTWGMYPGHISNTATSPLNVILTAIAGRALGSYTAAVVFLSALELTAAFASARVIAARLRLPAFPWIALAILSANPLLLSTLGLEGVLFSSLLVAALAAFVAEACTALGILLALLTLARPDGALFAMIVCTTLAWNRRLQSRTLIAFVLTAIPWFLYSRIHLGALIPDTFFIKLNQGGGFAAGFAHYFRIYPVAAAASFILAPLGFFAMRGAPGRLLIAFAELHFVAYSLLNVPPYHWYYLPETISLGLAAALVLADWTSRCGWTPAVVGIVLPFCALAVTLIRQGYPLREPFIHTNLATVADYRQIAETIEKQTEPRQVVALIGEIGTLAFYSHRQLVNAFSDRSLALQVIGNTNIAKSRALRTFLIADTFWRPRQSSFDRPQFLLQYTHGAATYPPAPPNALDSWKIGTRFEPYGRLNLLRDSSPARP